MIEKEILKCSTSLFEDRSFDIPKTLLLLLTDNRYTEETD